MLALTAPRVNALRAYSNRQHGLDAPTFARSSAAIAKALQGGNHLTRDELGEVLGRAKSGGSPERRTNILLGAEIEGLVCSGPLRGKSHTYALVEERAPALGRLPDRQESLARLAHRFFVSHGPATLKDYAWWSGLTTADAKAGVEMATPRLACEVVGAWRPRRTSASASPRSGRSPRLSSGMRASWDAKSPSLDRGATRSRASTAGPSRNRRDGRRRRSR
jgi:hypothetical protein